MDRHIRICFIGAFLFAFLVGTPGSAIAHTDAPTQPQALGWLGVPSPTTTRLNSISMVSPTDGWIGGDGGTLLHYTGSTWTPYSIPMSTSIKSVSMSSTSGGWAVGYDSGTRKTVAFQWNGNAWNPITLPANFFAQSVSVPDSSNAWFAGGFVLCTPQCKGDLGGVINRWDGSAWSQTSTTPLHVYTQSISMSSATSGWVVGQEYLPTTSGHQSAIRRWDGVAWSASTHPYGSFLNAVATSGDTNAWVVSDSGQTLHWNGATWSQVASPVTSSLNAVSIVSATDVWAVGDSAILHWDGAAWGEVFKPTTSKLLSVSMVTDNDGWAVGENGTILHYSTVQNLFLPTIIR